MKINFTQNLRRSNKVIKHLPTSLLALGLLAGCDQPTADITYPPKVSATNGDTIIVRGTTRDPDNTNSVTVNGTNVSSTDDFATWEVSLALDKGISRLTVETIDKQGNANSSTNVEIERVDTFLVDGAKSAIDRDNNRLLMVDDDLNAVVAVDLTTGNPSILSDTGTPDATNPLQWPTSIAIDRANNRALVTDRFNYAVIAVDLSTGARSVLTNGSTPSGDNRLIRPVDIVVDSTNNRALVSDQGASAVVAVDLTTGQRSVLSNNSTPNTDNPLQQIDSIALDTARNRALLINQLNRNIIAIDLSNGSRSVFSDYTATSSDSLSFPIGLSIDNANDRAITIDYNQQKVFAIDLTTGEQSIISSDETASLLSYVRDIVVDADNNRALIPDALLDAVVAVDLTNSQSNIINSSLLGIDNVIGTIYGGVALDKNNNRVLVADDSSNSVVSVSLKTGKPEVFSDNTDVPANNQQYFAVMSNLVVDEANQRVLALERSTNRNGVFAIDIKTGARTVLSNNSTPNTDNPFENLEDIALDSANNRALVVASDQPGIYSVDLTTGARTVLSDNTTPNVNNPFGNIITSIAIDSDNNRAFIADQTNDRVMAVNLTSGERSEFWAFNTPTTYERPEGISLDKANNRLLVTAPGIDAMVAINLTTGVQSDVSSNTTPDASNPLHEPGKIALDSENNLAYVTDSELGLVVIDLETGRRVVFAR